MKQQDYRRAVGSIRWSAARRREIEAKLRQTAAVQAVQDDDEDEPIRIPHIMKVYEEQEARMKMERRQARMYLLVLAAAMLTIGGTVAAVAYGSRRQISDISQNEEIKPEKKTDSNENSITPDDLATPVIAPALTDQQDEPDCHGIAKTGSGFFFIGYEKATRNPEEGYSGTALRYYDEASGESVYLCAKPNCQHNGSEFCTATTQIYSFVSKPVYLDGYLYVIASDQREMIWKKDKWEKLPIVLLRYQPDGTEITQVAELNADEQTKAYPCDLIAHRGQLWMICTYGSETVTFDDNFSTLSQTGGGKYDIFCYEPAKQKITKLYTSGELQKNFTPFRGFGPEMKGAGDYVYFYSYDNQWRDPYTHSGIYRIDCRSGEIETVMKLKANKSAYYTVTDDAVYYTFGTSINDDQLIHRYDLQTGEDSVIVSLTALTQEQAPWYTSELAEEQKAAVYMHAMVADDAHIYLFWQLEDRFTENKEDNERLLHFVTEIDTKNGKTRTAGIDSVKNIECPEELIRKELYRNGYYDRAQNKLITGDHLTEADYQNAIENKRKETLEPYYDNTFYDGKDFYIHTSAVQYRISRDELFGDQNAEQLCYLQHYAD